MREKIKSCVNAFKESSFLKGIFVLGFSGILCKLIGMFYRIPLTNILGSEGMGVYGLVYPIYSLLLVVSSSALPLALSKIVAERVAQNDYKYIKKLKQIALNLMLLFGGVLSILLILFSGAFARLQGVAMAKLGFIFIAPSVLIVGLICVYRGVFQGYCEMRPTGVSQLIEQGVKLILGLALSIILLPYGISYAVGGTMLAITISEAVALIYLIIKYNQIKWRKVTGKLYEELQGGEAQSPKSGENAKVQLKIIENGENNEKGTGKEKGEKIKSGKRVKSMDILKNLLKVCVPVTFGGIVIPFCLVIDSFLIVNVLVRFGSDLNLAVADYGLYTNVVNTLINVPIVLVGTLGAVALPLVAKFKQIKEPLKMQAIVAKCINFTIFICVPCVLLFAVFSSPILTVLYPALSVGEIETASRLLVISSSTILSLGIFYTTASILQGAGKFCFSIVNCCCCSVIRILLYILLMRVYGIYAVAMASAIMYLVMTVMNVCYMIVCVGCERLRIVKIFLTAIIFICFSVCIYLCLVGFMHCYSILFAILFGGLIYVLLNYKVIVEK